jgi:hypothetical protein
MKTETQVAPMVNLSEYRARSSIEEHLGDSPQTPVKVSPQAADGQQPIAYFLEPRQDSSANGLLHGKQLHFKLRSSLLFFLEPEVASEAISKIRFPHANGLALA